MTDNELTKLCAEAMGIGVCLSKHGLEWVIAPNWGRYGVVYDPLHDDAQAMALDSYILQHGTMMWVMGACLFAPYKNIGASVHPFDCFSMDADMRKTENRRRFRVECVAKMQSAKTSDTSPAPATQD